MAKFLLQEEHGEMTSDVTLVRELIRGENFFHNEHHAIQSTAKDDICVVDRLDECIPVGSIAFVEEVLRHIKREHEVPDKYSKEWLDFPAYHITPINVPGALRADRFLNRKAMVVSAENLANAFGWLETDELFIKSDTHLKAPYIGIYKQGWALPVQEDKRFFVSTVVKNIRSEWRCFVRNGRVVDIRRYMGDPWSEMPNKSWLMDAIKTYEESNAPVAYTMDVGVTDEGVPFLIEVHNFVSCGLYGCENPEILGMLREGFRWELARL